MKRMSIAVVPLAVIFLCSVSSAQVCIKGRPTPECKTVLLIESSFAWGQRGWQATSEFGGIYNLHRRHALGASAFLNVDYAAFFSQLNKRAARLLLPVSRYPDPTACPLVPMSASPAFAARFLVPVTSNPDVLVASPSPVARYPHSFWSRSCRAHLYFERGWGILHIDHIDRAVGACHNYRSSSSGRATLYDGKHGSHKHQCNHDAD